VRFAVGAVVLLPFALRRPSAPGELRVGVLAGLCLLAGYLFQTVGLQYTSSTSSAFITYLLVVFVPILTAVLTRRPPERSVVIAVVLAVTGLLLLSGGLDGFGRGELLTLGCAFAFAVHILILGRTSHRYDPVRLTCWQVAVVSLACVGPGIGSGGYGFDAGVWAAAVFCGVAATALAFLGQVYGQRVVPAVRSVPRRAGACRAARGRGGGDHRGRLDPGRCANARDALAGRLRGGGLRGRGHTACGRLRRAPGGDGGTPDRRPHPGRVG